MIRYEDIISQLDHNIQRLLAKQITDPNSLNRGGFMDKDGLVGPNSVSSATMLCYGYLLEESRFFRNNQLLKSILEAGEFGRRTRRPSGNFDLLTTNFDSSPDTAFVVKSLAPAIKLANSQEDEGAQQIASSLGELIITGSKGIIRGGFHTPNHRWVILAALSMTQQLYPDLQFHNTISSYLEEGIDINSDGEYSERSTGIYNAIVNRALILSAEALDRPTLLEPVRRSLDFSYHLIHSDATIVTSISRRQDQGNRSIPITLADSFHAMSHIDDNGFFASIADWLTQKGRSGLICLSNFVRHPDWRTNYITREPLNREYVKVYPTSGIWRVRRKKMSATALAKLTSPFTIQQGQLEMIVKICSTFFATGQFEGEEFQATENWVRMKHKGRNKIYPEKDYLGGVYWLPIDEKVNTNNWQEVRGRRKIYQVSPLEVELYIEKVSNGFDLYIQTEGGLNNVPFQIECNLTPGGILDTDSMTCEGKLGNTVFLKSGWARYTIGEDCIHIGPGNKVHQMWKMRNSEVSDKLFRLLITDMTPIRRKLVIRCGEWSEAQQNWQDT